MFEVESSHLCIQINIIYNLAILVVYENMASSFYTVMNSIQTIYEVRNENEV